MSTAATHLFPVQTTEKITHTIVSVTPDMAKRWLDNNNPRNRPIAERRVIDYVSDMEAGRWVFNGETIQFDANGNLLNGQHRLTAIVRTGVPQTFLIVRGLRADSQLTMDQGTRRTPHDQLAIAGIVADNSIAAAVRVFIRWERGLIFGDQSSRVIRVTTSEVVRWSQEHPEDIQLLRDLTTAGVRKVQAAPAISLAVALRFALIDEVSALSFFGKLADGANLPINSPILTLKNLLEKRRGSRVHLTERDAIGYFVVAWNAWRTGKPMSKLQRPHGAKWTKDNFPEPK